MYIDTHCHISKDNIEEYYNNAIENNVKVLVSQSVDLISSKENISISNTYNNIYTCIGVHPENVDTFNNNELIEFKDLLKSKSVVGIGEIGLDYYYTKENMEKQKEVFREFLSLAETNNLSVIVHSRNATKDTLDIIKEYKVKGIIHCFSGSIETAREYIKLGFYIGIGGVVTFKNSNLKDIVKDIPIESIVLETDAPYLTPEPFRGKINESKYIPLIGEKISQIKGISIEEVMNITTSNAKKIYNIK